MDLSIVQVQNRFRIQLNFAIEIFLSCFCSLFELLFLKRCDAMRRNVTWRSKLLTLTGISFSS